MPPDRTCEFQLLVNLGFCALSTGLPTAALTWPEMREIPMLEMNTNDATPESSQTELVEAVLSYQKLRNELMHTSELEENERLAQEMRQVLEHLWTLLGTDLRQVTRGWTRSLVAQDLLATRTYHEALEALAMSLFGDIAAALPNVQIDPSKNIRAYLMRIAYTKLADQAQMYGRRPTYRRDQPDEVSSGVWGNDGAGEWMLSEVADPDSFNWEDRVTERFDDLVITHAVADYWRRSLKPADRAIMELRFASDRPLTSQEIAERLGPGWTAAAVRQRIKRVLMRTREYLSNRGLLDVDLDTFLDTFAWVDLANYVSDFWEAFLPDHDQELVWLKLARQQGKNGAHRTNDRV